MEWNGIEFNKDSIRMELPRNTYDIGEGIEVFYLLEIEIKDKYLEGIQRRYILM